MIKSTVWASVFLLLFTLFETAILSNITGLPVIPDLVLLVVLYVSFKNGSLAGETSGFISGLFLDFMSAAPLGLNSFIRTLIGYIAGLFRGTFNMDSFFLPAFIGFAATLFKVIFLWVLSFFFRDSFMVYHLASAVLWIEVAANTLLAPLVFKFLSLFSSLLLIKEGIPDAPHRS